MSPDRRQELGAMGERIAAAHLQSRGYRLLDRNFRTRYGELDLVAADGGCLVFCEVKTRTGGGWAGPLDGVGWHKRRQVRRMAREWLQRAGERMGGGRRPAELRFDAIGVTVRPGKAPAVEHLEGAF